MIIMKMIKRDKQEISTETYLKKTKTKKEDMEKADTIMSQEKKKRLEEY